MSRARAAAEARAAAAGREVSKGKAIKPEGRVDKTIQINTGRSACIAWCAGIIVTAGLLNQWPRWIVGLSSIFLVAMWAVTFYLVGRP